MQAFLEEAKRSSRTIANLSTAVKNRVLNEKNRLNISFIV